MSESNGTKFTDRFTLGQVAVGSFFGGPLAACVFLGQNAASEGQLAASKRLRFVGYLLMFIASVAACVLDKAYPGLAVAGGSALCAYAFQKQREVAAGSSAEKARASNGSALKIALACLAAQVAVTIVMAIFWRLFEFPSLAAQLGSQ